MIKRVSHATLWVHDQEAAKAFYTEKLGFEVRDDMMMEGFRWLTVAPKGQADLRILLAEPKPPLVDDETGKAIRALLAKGAFGAGVLETDDCRKDYDRLSSLGVTFLQTPAERPYGVEALLRDVSGNWFSLTERRAGSRG